MPKVLYVATVVKTHIMEFHIPYLKMLKEMGWETAVAARNDFDDPADCVIPFCDTYYDVPFERNPVKPGNIKAYKQLKKIIDEGQYDIIHCHTPVGAMLTRLAATDARKKGAKVIYTAHGFHFYKGAPLINWLAYYPVEKALARKTDVLITINKEDYQRAKSKFNAGRVEYVPGVGIDVKKFGNYSLEHAEAIRRELGIAEGQKVLLSVGEVNKNKNHGVVIDVLPNFPDLYYIICGRGPLIEKYKKKAQSIGVDNRVRFAGYRSDVIDFYGLADVFVFPSIREGLPVALMEAMAVGVVCVASKNRGSNDLLSGSTLRFGAINKEELKTKLQIALSQDCSEEIKKNQETVQKYDISNTKELLLQIYEKVLEEEKQNETL